MCNYQLKHSLTACVIVLTSLAVGSSCSENDAEEMPTSQSQIAEITPLGTAATSQALFGGGSLNEIGKKIPNETAKRWIEKHDASTTSGIKYHLFGRNTFQRLLNDPKAAGIRLCYAVDDTGTPIIVMVAVDPQNNVLDGADQEGYDDASVHCPPLCATDATN